jgi:hypothetical protein
MARLGRPGHQSHGIDDIQVKFILHRDSFDKFISYPTILIWFSLTMTEGGLYVCYLNHKNSKKILNRTAVCEVLAQSTTQGPWTNWRCMYL